MQKLKNTYVLCHSHLLKFLVQVKKDLNFTQPFISLFFKPFLFKMKEKLQNDFI